MARRQAGRRSRKRRASPAAAAARPRPEGSTVAPDRPRAGRSTAAADRPRATRSAAISPAPRPAHPSRPTSVGERPASPFGGLPVSEIAIAIGLLSLAIGYFESNPAAAIVGAVICGLGVLEVTAREHFSGFRSHSTLLALIPAVVTET